MKIRLTLKDPDALYNSLNDMELDRRDLDEQADAVITKFLKWGEYLTVELDTETQTAVVVPYA